MKRIALLLFLCASAFAQRQSTFWTIIGRGTVAPSTCSGNVIFIISTDGSYRYCNGSSFINPFSGLGGGGIGTLNTLTDATQAFAKTNDTNVTLTITSSSPTHTFALGWTGTLAAGRLNSNVVQGVTNDTNVTGSISTQNLTLGWTGTLAAGRLNGNVVQGITNDTNVTGSISAQNLTIGWTGTLAKARQNSATVYNDAANTWSTGLQDLGAATLKIPSGAGFTAASSSMLGYDSTNKNFHGYLNAADAIIPGFASAPTNGHCLQASVVSGNVLLSDAGAACGTGNGTVTSSGTPLVHQVPVWTTATDAKGIAVGATDKPLVGATGADPAFSKLTLTNPATSATLTVADGASLITSGAFGLTLTATATTNATLPAGTKTLMATDTAVTAAQLPAQYKIWTCETGLGDGLNAVTAGTYLQSFCWNKTGATVTLTSLQCYTDNAGSSTMAATDSAATALLTGAVTCSSTIASGTQSATTTIAANDFLKFTFVADGTSKQTTWVIAGTY